MGSPSILGASGSTGFVVYGKAINDINVRNLFTSNIQNGVVITYTGGGGSFSSGDLHFIGTTIDNFTVYAIRVTGLTDATLGSVNFLNGYALNISGTGSPACPLSFQNDVGVDLSNFQVGNVNGNAICVTTSSRMRFTNNTFHNVGGNWLQANAMKDSIFSNNTGFGITGKTFINLFTGSSYNNLGSNVLSGPGSIGFLFDSTSNYNNYSGSITDPTSITTLVSDAGIGNLSGSNQYVIPTIVSAATTALTSNFNIVNGSAAVATLTVPYTGTTTTGGCYKIYVPSGSTWTWTNAGNILTTAGTAVVGHTYDACWVGTGFTLQ
jgi:hypothetical protein